MLCNYAMTIFKIAGDREWDRYTLDALLDAFSGEESARPKKEERRKEAFFFQILLEISDSRGLQFFFSFLKKNNEVGTIFGGRSDSTQAYAWNKVIPSGGNCF